MTLTPGELYACLDGYKMRLKQEDQRRAYFVSALVSTQTKEPVTMADLYDPLWYSPEEVEKRKNERLKNENAVIMKEFEWALKEEG